MIRFLLVLTMCLSFGICAEVSRVQGFVSNPNDLSIEKQLDNIDLDKVVDNNGKPLSKQTKQEMLKAIKKFKKDMEEKK